MSWITEHRLVGLPGEQLSPAPFPLLPLAESLLHSCSWATSSSCLLASLLSQHFSSPLPSHTSPMPYFLSCFWDWKLLCFVPKPIVSLSVCWGLCGGGVWSSEYLWKRGGGKRSGEVHIHAARLSFIPDLQCSVSILISNRKKTPAVSNVSAIPSTQTECLRQD